jgi:hypothetical protein
MPTWLHFHLRPGCRSKGGSSKPALGLLNGRPPPAHPHLLPRPNGRPLTCPMLLPGLPNLWFILVTKFGMAGLATCAVLPAARDARRAHEACPHRRCQDTQQVRALCLGDFIRVLTSPSLTSSPPNGCWILPACLGGLVHHRSASVCIISLPASAGACLDETVRPTYGFHTQPIAEARR